MGGPRAPSHAKDLLARSLGHVPFVGKDWSGNKQVAVTDSLAKRLGADYVLNKVQVQSSHSAHASRVLNHFVRDALIFPDQDSAHTYQERSRSKSNVVSHVRAGFF